MRNPLPIQKLMLGLLLLTGCATQQPMTPIPPEWAKTGGTADASGTAKTINRQATPVGHYRAATVTGDYAGYSDLNRFIERMVNEQGFSREYLNGLFSQAHRKQWTIDYMNKQAPVPSGGAKPRAGGWTTFCARFLDEQHIAKGAAFWRQHAQALQRASERYGVPPEYVLGIMGVETIYGGNVGNHRIIDALTTLAFDYPRRAEYFTQELTDFLLMARNEGFDPSQPVGSFAGAMGLGQFMPGSFLRWAVDFDGDGRRNLWDPEDAIGSISNYFAEHGWRPSEPVATPAIANSPVVQNMEAGFDTHYNLTTLTAAGVRPVQACPVNDDLRLLRLRAKSGDEYWLGHQNFYVITRYNNNTYYAMTVHQLAQAIKARYMGL
ncbi:MAG: lytic murein transglycosylase B [Methylococcaceae bacterium]|nr:MAG: lytic murein transglycosylase B [Methylococcaceae bacterium]